MFKYAIKKKKNEKREAKKKNEIINKHKEKLWVLRISSQLLLLLPNTYLPMVLLLFLIGLCVVAEFFVFC